MKKITSLIFMLISLSTFAQYTNIKISENNSPNEPAICINPYNTNQLVAGANTNIYYYSDDSGYTWTEGVLTSDYGVWGDPCIGADNKGDFYFFHLASPPEETGTWIDRIVCQKSFDGGVSWQENGTYTGLNGTKKQDKEWIAFDRANNNVYVTWTQFDTYYSPTSQDSSIILFSKSEDAGVTWSEPKRLSKTGGDCADEDETVEGAVPTVGTNGEIYVAWAGRKTNGDLAIMFDKSTDYGETWLENDIVATDFSSGWAFDIPGISRCNGLPITACDTSGGANNGTIYINWSDQRNGTDDTDIWLVKSTDNGDTWSEPIRVNDDEAGNQQFFTWMTIDQTNGYLYFVFYDRRNYSDNQTDVYMAVSKDGGITFDNIKISESPFTPTTDVFFGDYTNITAHNGIVRPIWARGDGVNMSIYTAIIEEEVRVPENSNISDNLFIENPNPNPFRAASFFTFKLHRPTKVSLTVFDVFGRKICTIIDSKYMKAGKYTEKLDAEKYNLSEGIYYFRFYSEKKVYSKKIILRK